MPAKRELTMRQFRQMLRLHRDGVSAREIGRTLGVARSTVQDNLKRAAAAGLAWPLAAELTDGVLEQRLFARAGGEVWIPLAVGAGLGGPGARTEASRRQSDGALGGVPGRAPGWLRLLAVLRPVPGVRAAPVARDAPAPRSRRQGVRRLLGQEDRDCRSRDQCGARRRDPCSAKIVPCFVE